MRGRWALGRTGRDTHMPSGAGSVAGMEPGWESRKQECKYENWWPLTLSPGVREMTEDGEDRSRGGHRPRLEGEPFIH